MTLTDTGENVQMWTRVFSTRRWVILVAWTRRKKKQKIACPLLDVFACGQVSSLRLDRLIWLISVNYTKKGSSKIFENSFLKNDISQFWSKALIVPILMYSNDNKVHYKKIISTKIEITYFRELFKNCHLRSSKVSRKKII